MTGSTDEGADLVLRPAAWDDAATLADLFIAAREAAYPSMPHSVHTVEETHEWFRELLIGGRETWVAEQAGGVVGFQPLPTRACVGSNAIQPAPGR